LTNADTYSIMI